MWLYHDCVIQCLLNSTDTFRVDPCFAWVDPWCHCVLLLQCPVWNQKWQSLNVSHGRKYISHNVCAKCPMSVGKFRLNLAIRFLLYSRPITFPKSSVHDKGESFTFMRRRRCTWFALQLNQCPVRHLPALSELSVGFSSDGICWMAEGEGIISLDLWSRWKKIKLYFQELGGLEKVKTEALGTQTIKAIS